MFKKNIFFFLAFLILSIGNYSIVRAENCEQETGYELYTCRVNVSCDQYDQPLRMYNTEIEDRAYQEGYNLYIAKNLYRKNMNNIYRCGMLKAQNNAYELIINKINASNKNSSTFESLTDNHRKILAKKMDDLECLKTEKEAFFLKKQVLDETTLEMCKYLTFLDYIKDTHVVNIAAMIKDEEISKQVEVVYEQDPEAGIEAYMQLTEVEEYEFQRKNYTAGYILDLEQKSRLELSEEIEHTKKVYEVAFQTYSNYENNMVIHLLLELLKNDFIQLRNNIYSTVSPINQVVYKIANAMSF